MGQSRDAGPIRLVLLTMLMAVGAPATAPAQTVTTIDSVPDCATCRIEFGQPIELRGEFEDASVLGSPASVQVAADGRIYVVYNTDRTSIRVYAPDGSYTGRIGREGEGPGEFRWIRYIRVDGDVIHAFDWHQLRMTDIDRRTGAVIRTVLLPDHWRSLSLADGRTVLGGAVKTRQAIGQPLHMFDAEGTWQRSFGVDEPAFRPRLEPLFNRYLAAAGPSMFWAAPVNEYRIELWHADGRLLRTLVLEREWFERWTQYPMPSRDTPPATRLWGLTMGPRGYLWTLFTAAAEDWADAMEDITTNREGGPRLVLKEGANYMVNILEAIDPEDGTLLARLRFEENPGIFSFAGPNPVVKIWHDSNDLPRLQVVPVHLVGLPDTMPDGGTGTR
ncbi:MAG TPA: 6-bladed beta-propeller [Longimicrobiales bacterium]